jgi:hypothetical protein
MPNAFTFGSALMDEALLTRPDLSSLEALVLLLSKADAIGGWVLVVEQIFSPNIAVRPPAGVPAFPHVPGSKNLKTRAFYWSAPGWRLALSEAERQPCLPKRRRPHGAVVLRHVPGSNDFASLHHEQEPVPGLSSPVIWPQLLLNPFPFIGARHDVSWYGMVWYGKGNEVSSLSPYQHARTEVRAPAAHNGQTLPLKPQQHPLRPRLEDS